MKFYVVEVIRSTTGYIHSLIDRKKANIEGNVERNIKKKKSTDCCVDYV